MAHYAFLDDQNVVTHVIVGIDETELIEGEQPETYYSRFVGQPCVRTSYNNRIRKQFAGIGYRYDKDADVFISPQPFPSWSLNNNYDWQAPIPKPEGAHNWNEESQTWIPVDRT